MLKHAKRNVSEMQCVAYLLAYLLPHETGTQLDGGNTATGKILNVDLTQCDE